MCSDPLEHLVEQQKVREACAGLMLRAVRDLLDQGERAESAVRWFLADNEEDSQDYISVERACAMLNFSVVRVRRVVRILLESDDKTELAVLLRRRT